eukprot:sb/3475309/
MKSKPSSKAGSKKSKADLVTPLAKPKLQLCPNAFPVPSPEEIEIEQEVLVISRSGQCSVALTTVLACSANAMTFKSCIRQDIFEDNFVYSLPIRHRALQKSERSDKTITLTAPFLTRSGAARHTINTY